MVKLGVLHFMGHNFRGTTSQSDITASHSIYDTKYDFIFPTGERLISNYTEIFFGKVFGWNGGLRLDVGGVLH